eukprot:CAMPEP_0176364902 /NCGR_PEP_ID=MMETSP0126-20121128/20104_1 /TAXON_ID=141414 ORGANISM="Strombidinopsis acuminatum, Strain SPMC142" /NCGR_SAMPLE_ID=MMETSP0126 /ASSEMBLY_ACC=CAM_ASM_000229 /LENGTH=65 /DNA_ID=CAMNT_0017721707 /DNA_START=175 /DNA_END=372 /DNA_ORIENTATION=+
MWYGPNAWTDTGKLSSEDDDDDDSSDDDDVNDWVSGTAYTTGDQVIGSNGKIYQCREWPNSGWCP